MAQNLTLDQAMALAKKGWQIRRALWCDASITGLVLPPGAIELKWIRFHRDSAWHDNAFWIKSTSITDRIMLGSDLTIADADARDWTTDGINVTADPSNTWTNPNAGQSSGSDASGGSGGSGGSSGGSGGGTGGSSTPPFIGGGGSGGGGDGSGGGRRPSRPARTAPALTVTVNRVTVAACVPRDSGDVPVLGKIDDQFTVTVELATDAGHTGELWFVSARWGCEGRGAVCVHGTLHPGGSTSASFSVHASKLASVRVTATANLPLAALVSEGSDVATMRDDCAAGGVSGCTNPYASNYNSAATLDDSSCTFDCPTGYHWDFVTNSCIPDDGGGGDVCPPVTVGALTDRTVATGDDVTVYASVGSTTRILSYQWFKDGTPISGAIGSSLILYGVVSGDGGAYSVTVTNDCGNNATQGMTLTVD
jgi:hypothetical protein